MKIKSIKLKNFKRFTDLTIKEIPETAKLVVMTGPNGCGKSSVFDALKLKDCFPNAVGPEMISDNYYQLLEYYFKSNEDRYSYSYYGSLNQTPNERMRRYLNDMRFAPLYSLASDLIVDFHGKEPTHEWDKSVHVRSAYRSYSVTQPHTVRRHDPLQEHSLVRLIENDEVLVLNCWRLASQLLERSSEIEQNGQDLADLQEEIFGELRDAMSRLFNNPPLILRNLGNPLDGDFFQFDKGISERFSFQNLASGEKAALDLLLDVIVTKAEYDETIICIDEPEAHIHTKLQGQLLEELYDLISPKSQLWIATHSIGMVRKAQDLWREDPDSVVFLDFGNHNFDEPVTLTPTEPNPNFWARTYDVALGDLTELVSPEQFVFCEGEDFDEACYQNIFESRSTETRFISMGGRNTVEKAVTAIKGKIARGAKVIGVVDRDRATNAEIERDAKKGIRTLSRKTIESYLLDDEVLTKLCEDHDKPDKIEDLLKAKSAILCKRMAEGRSKSPYDLKPIAQDIHAAAQKVLESANLGNSKESFMKDILAPLVKPGMEVYEDLHKDIFGEQPVD